MALTTLSRLQQGLDAIREREHARSPEPARRELAALLRLSRLLRHRGEHALATGVGLRSFADGVAALMHHHLLEMCNAHAVLHRGEAGLAPRLAGYESALSLQDWVVAHNGIHHRDTNVVGRDNDFDLLVFRFSDRQRFRPHHMFQVPLLAMAPWFTMWFTGLGSAVGRARQEGRPPFSRETVGPVLERVLAEVTHLAAGSRRQALGRFAAKLLSDALLGAAFYSSHHGLASLDLEQAPESRPEEALRQILGTLNVRFARSAWGDRYLRGIDYHIEHHLFPDVPVERLKAIHPEVRALCEELGIPHETTSLLGAFAQTLALAAWMSVPGASAPRRQRARRDLYRRLRDEHRQNPSPPRRRTQPSYRVTLRRSGRTLEGHADQTLLEILEGAGVEVPAGCRTGSCHACLTPKEHGTTSQDPRGDRAHVNVCVARPRSDLTLDR